MVLLLLLHVLLAGGNNTDVDMVDSGQMEEFSQSIPGVNLTYLGRVRQEAGGRSIMCFSLPDLPPRAGPPFGLQKWEAPEDGVFT